MVALLEELAETAPALLDKGLGGEAEAHAAGLAVGVEDLGLRGEGAADLEERFGGHASFGVAAFGGNIAAAEPAETGAGESAAVAGNDSHGRQDDGGVGLAGETDAGLDRVAVEEAVGVGLADDGDELELAGGDDEAEGSAAREPAADEFVNAGGGPAAGDTGADVEGLELLFESGLLFVEHVQPGFEGLSVGDFLGQGLAEAGLDFVDGGDGGLEGELEFVVGELEEGIAGGDGVAGFEGEAFDAAWGFGDDEGALGGLDHAGGGEEVGEGDDGEEGEGGGGGGGDDGDGAGADAVETWAGPEVAGEADGGGDEPGDGAGGEHDEAEEQVAIGDGEEDTGEDEDAVEAAGDAVEAEPGGFGGGAGGGVAGADAEEVMFADVSELAVGEMGEVGNAEEIAKDVIAVEAEQGVEIEDEGADAGDEHEVVGHAMDKAGAGAGPDDGGDGGDEEFDEHAGEADEDALPASAEAPARGDVHVGHRGEDHEEDAEGMDLTAIAAAGEGVAEFVEGFEQDEGEVEEDEVAGCEHALVLVESGVPVIGEVLEAETDEDEPEDGAEGAEEGAYDGEGPAEETVRIEDRDAEEHDVGEAGLELAAGALAIALEEGVGIAGAVVVEEVGLVELADEAEGGLLAGGFVGEAAQTFLPGLVDGTVAAEAGDEFVGGGAETEELVGERVFEHVEAFAAEGLAADAHSGVEGDALAGDAMPGFGERLGDVGHRVGRLPPEVEAEEVDGAMGEDPDEAAGADVDFGDALHAGAEPGGGGLSEVAAVEEDVTAFAGDGGGFEGLALDVEFEGGLGEEGDLAGFVALEFVHVAFGEFGFDEEAVEAGDAEEGFALAEGLAEALVVVALDDDTVEGTAEGGLFDAVPDLGEAGEVLADEGFVDAHVAEGGGGAGFFHFALVALDFGGGGGFFEVEVADVELEERLAVGDGIAGSDVGVGDVAVEGDAELGEVFGAEVEVTFDAVGEVDEDEGEEEGEQTEAEEFGPGMVGAEQGGGAVATAGGPAGAEPAVMALEFVETRGEQVEGDADLLSFGEVPGFGGTFEGESADELGAGAEEEGEEIGGAVAGGELGVFAGDPALVFAGEEEVGILVGGFLHHGFETLGQFHLAVEAFGTADGGEADGGAVEPAETDAFGGEAVGEAVAEGHGGGVEAVAILDVAEQFEGGGETFVVGGGFAGLAVLLSQAEGVFDEVETFEGFAGGGFVAAGEEEQGDADFGRGGGAEADGDGEGTGHG